MWRKTLLSKQLYIGTEADTELFCEGGALLSWFGHGYEILRVKEKDGLGRSPSRCQFTVIKARFCCTCIIRATYATALVAINI